LSPSQEVAIVGDPAADATAALLHEVRRRYLPTTVLALNHPDAESYLPVLTGRGLVDGKPAAYVCENYACKLPVTEAKALGDLLDGQREWCVGAMGRRSHVCPRPPSFVHRLTALLPLF